MPRTGICLRLRIGSSMLMAQRANRFAHLNESNCTRIKQTTLAVATVVLTLSAGAPNFFIVSSILT
jgi:hypothetical protein